MSNDCDHRFCPHLHICIFAYRPPDGSLRGQGEPDSFSITLKEEIKYIARGKLNECLLNLAQQKRNLSIEYFQRKVNWKILHCRL